MLATVAGAAPENFVTGNVRVQLLSDTLLRIELKGSEGFENRDTFHIVNRDWPGTVFSAQTNAGIVEIRTENYLVRLAQNAVSLDGISVSATGGVELYRYDGKLENSQWLPAPEDKPQAWWFADTPRIVPSPWGLTPPPPHPMPDLQRRLGFEQQRAGRLCFHSGRKLFPVAEGFSQADRPDRDAAAVTHSARSTAAGMITAKRRR